MTGCCKNKVLMFVSQTRQVPDQSLRQMYANGPHLPGKRGVRPDQEIKMFPAAETRQMTGQGLSPRVIIVPEDHHTGRRQLFQDPFRRRVYSGIRQIKSRTERPIRLVSLIELGGNCC